MVHEALGTHGTPGNRGHGSLGHHRVPQVFHPGTGTRVIHPGPGTGSHGSRFPRSRSSLYPRVASQGPGTRVTGIPGSLVRVPLSRIRGPGLYVKLGFANYLHYTRGRKTRLGKHVSHVYGGSLATLLMRTPRALGLTTIGSFHKVFGRHRVFRTRWFPVVHWVSRVL